MQKYALECKNTPFNRLAFHSIAIHCEIALQTKKRSRRQVVAVTLHEIRRLAISDFRGSLFF
jgi:hypothetical protein